MSTSMAFCSRQHTEETFSDRIKGQLGVTQPAENFTYISSGGHNEEDYTQQLQRNIYVPTIIRLNTLYPQRPTLQKSYFLPVAKDGEVEKLGEWWVYIILVYQAFFTDRLRFSPRRSLLCALSYITILVPAVILQVSAGKVMVSSLSAGSQKGSGSSMTPSNSCESSLPIFASVFDCVAAVVEIWCFECAFYGDGKQSIGIVI